MTPEQLEIARANAQRIVNAGGTDAIDYPVAVGFLSLIAQVEAGNRKSLELQRVYDERGLQIGRLDVALDRLRAQVEALTMDAERWQFLVSIMESAKGSAHLTVNQHLAYYDECEPGEEVSLQWYPDTPIGFYKVEGSFITQVVDEARSEFAAPTIPAITGTKEGA